MADHSIGGGSAVGGAIRSPTIKYRYMGPPVYWCPDNPQYQLRCFDHNPSQQEIAAAAEASGFGGGRIIRGESVRTTEARPTVGFGGSYITYIFIALIIAVPLYWIIKVGVKLRTKRSLLRKMRQAIEQHSQALIRQRSQLVQYDPYGNEKLEKWNKAIDYFLFHHLSQALSVREQQVLKDKHQSLVAQIEDFVKERSDDDPPFRTFSEDMSSAEFEEFCAGELRQVGWNAHVTLKSRDQGIDVIADKSGVRIVIQCKKYRSPVGNKAVQEIAAGRAHEMADYAIVVTNSSFTPSAKQLALTNNVDLLHYRDLHNIDAVLQLEDNGRIVPLRQR
jgi:restriction system protein